MKRIQETEANTGMRKTMEHNQYCIGS